MKQVTATVTANSKVMPEAHLIWLESPEIASNAQPGQFVMVRCGAETILPRPLSIHQQDGNKIALLFNIVGTGTTCLSQRKAGDGIQLFGPLGNHFSIQSDSHDLLLIAGGMGIAPLLFLAQQALKQGCTVTVLYGTANKYQYPEKLLPDGLRKISATEDGSIGHHGMVTEILPG